MIEADTFGKLFQAFVGCSLKNATPGWCRQICKTRLLFPKPTKNLWGMIVGKHAPQCQLAGTSECLEIRQINQVTARSSDSVTRNRHFANKIAIFRVNESFFLNEIF